MIRSLYLDTEGGGLNETHQGDNSLYGEVIICSIDYFSIRCCFLTYTGC